MSDNVIPEELLEKIKVVIYKNIQAVGNIKIHFELLDIKDKGQNLVKKAWKGLLKCLFNRVPAARMWMLNSHWELNNNCLHIYLEKNGIEFLKKRRCHFIMENYFKNLGFPLKIIFEERVEEESYDIYEEEREIVEYILKQNEYESSKSDINNTSPIIIGKMITGEQFHWYSINETKEIIFPGRYLILKSVN